MYLVGVIDKNKEITKNLKKAFSSENVDFINLDLGIIENFKNVKFDILLISNFKKNSKSINKKVFLNSSIYLINTDVKENLNILESLKGVVITYGFNTKASVTVSSVDDENISICIQRGIESLSNQKIEPIEYVESIKNLENVEISDVIGIKTAEILLTKKKN